MLKRGLFIVLILLGLLVEAHAESREMRATHPHELRIGYGDPMFETTAFYASMHRDYTYLAPTHTYLEQQNYRYTGHLMLEYMYRPNSWFGIGLQADGSAFMWDKMYYKGGSNEPLKTDPQYCYNVAVMPTVRFTWVHHYWFDMYSGLGLGAVVNGGTETNDKGQHVALGLAADLALWGMTVGRNHVYGGLEVGGLVGLCSIDTLFLVGSRIFTASFGVRF